MENMYKRLDAEKGAIGAALDSDKCAEKLKNIPLFYFSDEKLRAAAKWISKLQKDGMPVNLSSLVSTMEADGIQGAFTALVEAQQEAFVSQFDSYLKALKVAHGRRQIRNLAQKMIEETEKAETTPEEISYRAINALKKVDATDGKLYTTSEEALLKMVEQVESVHRGDDDKRCITGVPAIDRAVRISGSKLIVVAARTGVGKSAFVTNIAIKSAERGNGVAFFSLEMEDAEIMEREIAHYSGVDLDKIEMGLMNEQDFAEIGKWYTVAGYLPIYFNTTAFTVEKLRTALSQMMADHKINLVVVDYIQKMRGDQRQTRYEQVTDISGSLKEIAQELCVPVIALSQLNRGPEGNGRRREPTMAEARDSGAVEQDANVFILLHDPEEKDAADENERGLIRAQEAQGKKLIKHIVTKNRQGKRLVTYSSYDGAHMRYTEIIRRSAY